MCAQSDKQTDPKIWNRVNIEEMISVRNHKIEKRFPKHIIFDI